MIRRFRLEQKGRYEKLVIAQRLSDMLDKFLSGRPAPLCIGAEQGDIGEWDDVVIHHDDSLWEHLQIKRQSTPFCNKHVDKADYLASRRPRKRGKGAKNEPINNDDQAQPGATEPGEPVAVPADKDIESELDKAFKSLAAWYHTEDAKRLPIRAFSLTLAGLEVGIKGKHPDAIRVSHLHEFCELCRKDGVDLAALAKRDDKPTQNVYKWLTTWCGFNDWRHVQETMRLLKINCVGEETTLEARAHESLGRHFIQPEVTLSLLVDYISDSTTDTNVVSCHAAARYLQKMLRTGAETWTQYLSSPVPGQGWKVAGTHDLDVTPTVPPSHAALDVVNHHWGDTVQNRKLRLHANYVAPTPNIVALPSAILRLALHLKAGSHCLLLGEGVWRQGAHHELGGTLGVGEQDLEKLPWLENPEALSCAQGRMLSTLVETRSESAALHSAMNDLVWQKLQSSVEKKLNKIADLDLLAAMEAKWGAWRVELSADPAARQLLFEQLMYPQTEGIDAKHALRIGPSTVDVMETAILMLLLVCVGLGQGDAHWRSIPPIGDVLSIAVTHWSGEATDNDGPRYLGYSSLRQVLGQSPPPLVILAGIEASATEVLEAGLADDLEAGHSMAAEVQPRLLVTRSQVYKQIRTGTLAKLQEHFKKHWNAWRLAREEAIEACGKGH